MVEFTPNPDEVCREGDILQFVQDNPEGLTLHMDAELYRDMRLVLDYAGLEFHENEKLRDAMANISEWIDE